MNLFNLFIPVCDIMAYQRPKWFIEIVALKLPGTALNVISFQIADWSRYNVLTKTRPADWSKYNI